ncbi:HAMP domain-containing histidine kinase [Rhodobacteraceae bacterium LMO-12]|nr:HAMP domain-containing histidine kinase [Rhodobacteraceae bacterium LMO-JJ12]
MRRAAMQSNRIGRTSFRLSLQFSFLYSLLMAVIFIGAYWMTDREVGDWVYDRMESDVATLSEIYEQKGLFELTERINALTEVNFENSRIFRLTDAQGDMLAGNILAMASDRPDGFVRLAELSLSGSPNNEVSGYWMTQQPIGPYLLLQGTGDNVVAEVLEVLSAALVGGFIVVIGLGLLVGVRVGRITETRITGISSALDRVAEGDLGARVPVSPGSKDDLGRVSASINATLGQLQALLESQQQISTDIAHDMRTPLQRLRQRLERMEAQHLPDPADAAAALHETEDIISTFNALLRIAQIEAGDRRERFSDVDLNQIAETVFEAFEPTADEAGQTLQLKPSPEPVSVSGDRDLLMQMAANLVENGLRHCSVGSAIEIGVTTSGDRPSLWVSDNGTGIAPADAKKVFRRFYRGEKSRTSQGHGLGLAMVKAVADLHDASILISDNRPGLRMSVAFPTSRKLS